MKLVSIQYLRGLAAMLVILAHAADHPLAETPSFLTQLGELGVTLFFVISGFIMVAISGRADFNPLTFLKRRAIRIVPLYWCFTTLAAVMALGFPTLFKNTIFTLPHYVLSLFFVPHESPAGGLSPLLSLGWTLNYEVFFYLAFALLAFLTARRRVSLLTLVFASLAAYGLIAQPQNVLGFYANASLLAFCAGTWIGLLHLEGRLDQATSAQSAGLALAALLAMGLGLAGTGIPGYVPLLIGSAALVVLGLKTERRLPRWHVLEHLGDASYSLYLTHIFVVGAVVALGSRLLPIEGPLGYLVLVTAATGAAIIGGLLVHRMIEKPLLALFNRRKSPAGLAQSPRPASA